MREIWCFKVSYHSLSFWSLKKVQKKILIKYCWKMLWIQKYYCLCPILIVKQLNIVSLSRRQKTARNHGNGFFNFFEQESSVFSRCFTNAGILHYLWRLRCKNKSESKSWLWKIPEKLSHKFTVFCWFFAFYR